MTHRIQPLATAAALAAIGLSAFAGLTGSALAQTAFGTLPGENSNYVGLEQRFNQLQYHATHNSYQRDLNFLEVVPSVDIREQLDSYNVWCIELDVRWSETASDFWVFHSCLDDFGSNSLDYHLNLIQGSRRIVDGFTYVDLETWEIGPCVFFPSIVPKPVGWKSSLRDKLLARFGSKIYTQDNFLNDGSRWPSAQELIRRGKHIAFQIKGPNTSNNHLDFFFAANGVYDDPNTPSSDESLNTQNENLVVTPGLLGDDRMARHYPGGLTCPSESSSEYTTAVGNGFTFTAANCSEKWGVPQLHPPIPTYVNQTPHSPSPRGTWNHPYHGTSGIDTLFTSSAIHAHFSAPSMVVGSIEGGVYQLTTGGPKTLGGPLTVNIPFLGQFTAPTPVRLTARDGQLVTLR